MNGHPIKSYIDMGSSCITIKKEYAEPYNFSIDFKRPILITGFGGAKTCTIGTTSFRLKVDQVELDVSAHVVPNNAQSIPILIGQPFTDRDGVLIIKDHQTLAIEQMDGATSSTTKISLRPVKDTFLPPNHIGYITVESSHSTTGDYYLENSLRLKEGQEHIIPRCMINIATDSCIKVPVINLSDHELHISNKRLLARAT